MVICLGFSAQVLEAGILRISSSPPGGVYEGEEVKCNKPGMLLCAKMEWTEIESITVIIVLVLIKIIDS